MNVFKNKLFLGFLGLLFLFLGWLVYSKINNNDYKTVEAKIGDLSKIVEISGKVVPAEEVNLSFNASANVTRVYKDVGDIVRVGDILAEIDSSQVQNEINEARTNVLSAEAELNKISGSNGYGSQIDVAKDNLVKNLDKAYINAEYVIRNNADTFFENANTINAEFILAVGSKTRQLNDGREVVQKVLEDWGELNSKVNKNNVSVSDVNKALSYIKQIDDFVALISSGSSDFEPQGSVTQSQIDSYVSSLGSSRSTLANIKIDLNNSLNTLNNLELDIPIQNAKIQNSEATVQKLRSKSSDYVLRAPFNGVITENNLEIGKYVSSSDIAFTLISDSPLEIETFIPEINIVGVDVGDKVYLNFDALGDLKLEATITHVDPKDTLKDGVVTYRTIISLLEPNENLRPGMTTNIEIIKEVIENQVIIPTYVIQNDESGDYVEVLVNGEIQKRNIEVLDQNSRTEAAISSGISEGEEIIIPNF